MKGITLPIYLVLALSPALAQLAFVLPMTSFSARHSIQGFNNKNAYIIFLYEIRYVNLASIEIAGEAI
ncbi:hypothetical protein M0L20_25785 [Spirosoma sp. RP8]|uniref:Uncharacterized protein n=1 Tax=Spirosoma liriopis TaxID=2937440 RepID=A0ABT0HSY4_9BACT|nr:hypothetical protein [Spirosoma liriopis]MCK8495303.1 hypothetical protein [Spirosoma liriopis]